MKKVIAILCSDLHLSHVAPVARSAESNWYHAMARTLQELRELADEHDAPVICAGDIFDRWNPPPELINFAIDELPHMWAVPGQHDLANHNYDEIERTAYWTLVQAGKITHLDGTLVLRRPGIQMQLFPFPWGRAVSSCPVPFQPFPISYVDSHPGSDNWIRLAVVHQYVFTKQSGGYPGAPKEQRLDNMADQLAGYDAAVFGDNHQAFEAYVGERLGGAGCACEVINCGTFMVRKQDERAYRPAVYLLHADAAITTHHLNIEHDKFADPIAAAPGQIIDSAEFLAELQSLGGDSLDFRAAINRLLEMDSPPDDVRAAVLAAVGE